MKTTTMVLLFRSNCPEVFCKQSVLRNFAKFTGKHLCQRLFFNKVAGLRPVTLLKKSLWHRCFHVNFAKFLRAHFSTEHHHGVAFGKSERPMHVTLQKRDFFLGFLVVFKTFSKQLPYRISMSNFF